jgi:two-component system sensor histidine kinase/response regulator
MPMSTMKMILNVLAIQMKEDKKISTEIIESIQNANEISEQLFRLLDNLLKWTKSQQGKLKAIPQPFCLANLAAAEVETASILAAPKNISIRLTSSAIEETEVHVDIDMIKTVMRNLISNAIKYSYRDSEIDLVVESDKDNILFKVIDRGCGVSEEDQYKLLNIATHFTTFGTEHESGSGLGLLLVNEFLKLNNGSLFFQSKEKEGSTFGFVLPAIKHPK